MSCSPGIPSIMPDPRAVLWAGACGLACETPFAAASAERWDMAVSLTWSHSSHKPPASEHSVRIKGFFHSALHLRFDIRVPPHIKWRFPLGRTEHDRPFEFELSAQRAHA